MRCALSFLSQKRAANIVAASWYNSFLSTWFTTLLYSDQIEKITMFASMKKGIGILLILFTWIHGVAQQSDPVILLMTGKVLDGTVTSEDSAYIYYEYEKSSGKVKQKKLDWERVFSHTVNGEETVVYLEDSTNGNYFTEEEMRYYILGEQDAQNGYKSNWTVWAGVPVTAGLGYVLSSSPLVFATPFVYMLAASMPKYKMTPSSISNPEYLKNPAYILGYERTARTKRLFKSLASGVAGAAIGVAIGQLTKP